jgi:hypothetical protein
MNVLQCLPLSERALVYLLCFVLFVLSPTHIPCLTVANGWNKERCIPEVLPLLRHKSFCSALGSCYYNSRIRYLIWFEIFAIPLRLHAIIWLWTNHQRHTENFRPDPSLISWTFIIIKPIWTFVFLPQLLVIIWWTLWQLEDLYLPCLVRIIHSVLLEESAVTQVDCMT